MGNDRHWIGGTGYANDSNHWSETSGGAGGASVPTSINPTKFDDNSFSGASQVWTQNGTFNCLDMDWTGVLYNPTWNNATQAPCNIYGSLKTISAMSYSGEFVGFINYASNIVGNTVETAGMFMWHNNFMGVGGGWSLVDELSVGVGGMYLAGGALDFNDQDVNCVFFNTAGISIRSMSMGNGTMSISDKFNPTGVTNFTLNAETSKIKINGDGTFFNGLGLNYYNLETNGNSVTITGDNTFNNLKIVEKTVNIAASSTQTFSSLTAIGTSGNEITIQSTSSGTAYNFVDSGGNNTVEYCSIKDCAASGGAEFIANYSTNVSGNTGWSFGYFSTLSTNLTLSNNKVVAIAKIITLSIDVGVRLLRQIVKYITSSLDVSLNILKSTISNLTSNVNTNVRKINDIYVLMVSRLDLGASYTKSVYKYISLIADINCTKAMYIYKYISSDMSLVSSKIVQIYKYINLIVDIGCTKAMYIYKYITINITVVSSKITDIYKILTQTLSVTPLITRGILMIMVNSLKLLVSLVSFKNVKTIIKTWITKYNSRTTID